MIRGTENPVIGDLLGRRNPFFVPKYQRNYAWDEEEVADFITDISLLFNKRASGAATAQKHFFGGIVSIDVIVPGSMHGRSFELVDGQQRLATFLITLSIIVQTLRRVAGEATAAGDAGTAANATTQANLTEQQYIKYQENVGGVTENKPRLTLSKADVLFFTDILNGVLGTPMRNSHEKLLAAHNRLQDGLLTSVVLAGALTPAQKVENLKLLQQALLEDCHVLFVYSDDHKEAYRLFRILNDRGRPISDGDKLRSHTLEILEGDPALQAVAEQQWDDILAMGEAEVDGFLQAYYTAQMGEKAPKRELFDQFVTKLLTTTIAGQQRQFIATRVQLLHTAKAYYVSIDNGEWPYSTPTASTWKRDRLARLMQVLRHNLCVPLLLAIREKQTEQVFTDAILLIERFAFRYVNVVAAHHNPPNTVYVSNIRAIRAATPTFSVAQLRTDLAAITQRYANDTVFEISLFNKLDYRQSAQRRLIKHLLATIEDYRGWLAAGGTAPMVADETRILDVSTNTIEHIYPQNSQPANVDATLEPLKQSLPNLTFWGASDNQAAGNLPFTGKVPFYQQSSIAMNRDLALLPAFTLTEATQRRADLLDAAKKIFAI